MNENRNARTPAPRMPQSRVLTVLGSNLAGGPPGAPPGGGPHWPGGGGGGVSPGGGWKVMSLSYISTVLAVLSGKVAPESAIRNDQAGKAAARRHPGAGPSRPDTPRPKIGGDPSPTPGAGTS